MNLLKSNLKKLTKCHFDMKKLLSPEELARLGKTVSIKEAIKKLREIKLHLLLKKTNQLN